MYTELVKLRSRRGIERPDLSAGLGPRIRVLGGVTGADTEVRIKQRVTALLHRLIEDLPPDLKDAARLAFALDKEHRYRTLEERVQTLASSRNYSDRTARRAMDEALRIMADAAITTARPPGESRNGPGWRVSSLRSLFRLDTATPELYEMRRILATEDITRITVRIGLPHPPAGQSGAEPTVDVLFGARVVTVERAQQHFRVILDLPRTLPADAEHDLWLRFVAPPGQPIWQHYAIVPLNPCDSGTVRVRFSPARLPAAVWVLDEVPYPELHDETPGPHRIEPDGSGDVMRRFSGLREGYGYGIAWTPGA
jgi:hypothetical protein